MAQARSFVGLDVHLASTQAFGVDALTGEVFKQRLSGRLQDALAWCGALPAPARIVYEAGPTGFGLASPAAPAFALAATPRPTRQRRTIVAVAAARELAGFCWAITTN